MISIQNLLRKNIASLLPYSSARDDFDGTDGVFLDANENPFGTLNRYPDPYQKQLKKELAKFKKVSAKNIFIGNGSDEVIDLAFRIFCEPGRDKALTFTPTYGMYDVSAAINDVELLKTPLNSEFNIDINDDFLQIESLKLIFICSPNNPTGNLIDTRSIEKLLSNFNGIVIIDEAYIDFCDAPSWNTFLKEFPNLIVCQTFSKAWGLAAARVGFCCASEEIISIFNKVKPPYNVSELNQKTALVALRKPKVFQKNIEIIKDEKLKLILELNKIDQVIKIYPSDANFLLVEVKDATELYEKLIKLRIITRNRNKQVKNCLRISIGTPIENTQLLNALKNK